MNKPGTWLSMQLQTISQNSRHVSRPKRFNPHPPGVMKESGAAKALFTIFYENPNSFFTRQQLIEASGRSEYAVDWGLIFLRSQRIIQRVEDSKRNSRYHRYRLSPDFS